MTLFLLKLAGVMTLFGLMGLVWLYLHFVPAGWVGKLSRRLRGIKTIH